MSVRVITRRSILGGMVTSISVAEAHARGFFGKGGSNPPNIKTITGASIVPASFIGGSPDGTVVGSILVQTTGSTPFVGTGPNPIQLTFTDAADFKLSSTTLPSNLELNGTQAAGGRSIKLILTDSSFVNSPFTTNTITITGTSTGAVHLYDTTATNDAAGTKTAGGYFLFAGLVFADGDLPAGTYPQLLVSGVPQPYTPFGITTWPSGAIARMAVMYRPTFSLTVGASQAVGVWNGGAVPAASGRSLATDVYPQNLSVQVAAAPPSGANLTGNWAAWVRNDSNVRASYLVGDGEAGAIWKQYIKFAPTAGGTPHGQLECEAWVIAFNDASGNLGGFGFMPRIVQPYWNNDTPAKNWRAFASVAWQYGAGPTSASFPWPFTNADFTWSSGQSFTSAGIGANLYCGASSGQAGQIIPGYLTTTGTLPGGLDANTIYFALVSSSSTSTVKFGKSTAAGSLATGTSAGSGTHTFHPIMVCNHFGTVFGATTGTLFGPTCQMFQGTGSISGPTQARSKFDVNYWKHSKMLGGLPLDVALAGTITAGTFAYDWNPMSIGPLYQDQEAPGGRPDLAPINAFSIRHALTQAAGDEKIVRMIGLAGAFEAYNFRDVTTGNFINLTNTTYTGMPAPSATQRGITWDANGPGGTWTFPPTLNKATVFNQNEMSHCTEFAGYAWLTTGEPWFLDIMVETALGGMLGFSQSRRNVTAPYTDYGIPAFNSQLRVVAWATRNLMLGAALMPDAFYDGSQLTTMFRDQANKTAKWKVDGALQLLNSFCQTNGMIMPRFGSGGSVALLSNWQLGYEMVSVAMYYAMRGNAKALEYLQNIATFYLFMLNNCGGYAIPSYHWHSLVDYTGLDTGSGPITSTAQFASSMAGTLSWTSGANPAFAITATSGVTLTNGDTFIFDYSGSQSPPTSVGNVYSTHDQPFYARDVVGNTFNLSATPGGVALIAPLNSGSQSAGLSGSGDGGPWTVYQTTAASARGTRNADSYATEERAMMAILMALGVTPDVTAVYNDIDDRITLAGGTDWNTNQGQQWALTPNY